jgi:hypothetical protein
MEDTATELDGRGGSFIASGVSFSVLIAVLLWAASTGGLD